MGSRFGVLASKEEGEQSSPSLVAHRLDEGKDNPKEGTRGPISDTNKKMGKKGQMRPNLTSTEGGEKLAPSLKFSTVSGGSTSHSDQDTKNRGKMNEK